MKKTIALSILLLSGCSTSNVRSNWQCPSPNGLDCVTITQADQKADMQQETMKHCCNNTGQIKTFKNHSERTNEKIGKVWVFPYSDSQGDYHEGRYVHILLEDNFWKEE